jgi:hypothetical protein
MPRTYDAHGTEVLPRPPMKSAEGPAAAEPALVDGKGAPSRGNKSNRAFRRRRKAALSEVAPARPGPCLPSTPDERRVHLRLSIGRACAALRFMLELRSALRTELARELRKADQERNIVLERALRSSIQKRAKHHRARADSIVSSIQAKFLNDPVFRSPLRLLLFIIGRQSTDAQGALVRTAACAAEDGSKR